MLCVSCGACGAPRASCCRDCRRGLGRGGERLLRGGLLVSAAFQHDGTARRLVHRLKYEGIAGAATPLAVAMAPAVTGARALIPVPRSVARLWRYGVDPARELAAAIAHITGIPVVTALAAGWWHAARAGPTARERGVPRFRRVRDADDWVLIDDVLTTGTTLQSAASCLEGAGRAVVATVAQAATARRR